MPLKTRRINDSYFELVREFPLRKLRHADEHRRALSILSRFAGRERMDAGVTDYLGVLVDLIADYERAAGGIEVPPASAVDVVRHLMAENDLTISGLAREIGVAQSNLSEILGGKREWSKKIIKALSERFALNPMIFLI